MKLIELEITEIRGIRHLLLSPQGQNLVISGPNGSGKSGVVDAIDFLLTGNIQRLSGRGTKGLTLKKHGVHVGSDPEVATVRAVIALDDGSQHELTRSIAAPGRIICSKEAETALLGMLALASRGQYVLSRREILRYITAEPGDRATEIQALLNLSDIEATRLSLGRFRTQMQTELTQQTGEVGRAEARLAAAAQLPSYDRDGVLEVVNAQRAVLGGHPLATLLATGLKANLAEPSSARRSTPAAPVTRGDLDALVEPWDAKHVENRHGLVTRFLSALAALCGDPARLRLANLSRLIDAGIALLSDDGACPLCDTPWDPPTLAEHLQAKQAQATSAVAEMAALAQLSVPLVREVRGVKALVSQIARAATTLNLKEAAEALDAWATHLGEAERYLDDPLGAPAGLAFTDDALGQLCRSAPAVAALGQVRQAVEAAVPAISKEQAAWDILTRIEEHTESLATTILEAKTTERAARRAESLVAAFETARNRVLQALYDRIKDRFVELYSRIHAADEAGFGAVLCPEGAALKFEVDFLGTGTYPPHALHSEGHQDCMGLCLYLSLAEYLNAGVIDLVVLDDVVMSVDAGHRREVCRVLAEQFADKQFLITTHERAWAAQLRTEGIVTGGNSLTFYNWTLAVGPCVEGGDMWTAISRHLERDDVPQAAHALRYGLEAFFRHVCGSLRGQIQYNPAERWDLGDFYAACLNKLTKYYNTAVTAAKAWQRPEVASQVEVMASLLVQATRQAQCEQPTVNWNVHFNEWANYTKQDFLPVVEAMQELCAQFTCGSCHGVLEAQATGSEISTVRCSCGEVMLNLQKPEPARKALVATM
jgi:hypothetical protein